MKLLKLEANNIFSIGKINLNLNNRGLLLITGYSYDESNPNGAGKSSIANKAISWGLYGRTFGGARADSVINSNHPNKESYVTIEFIGMDGNYYDIRRQRNPAKLEFHSDTVNLTQRNEKDTQALIDKALGKDFKTFSHTDFFGQGRTESFFTLTPSEQKEIIESILPIERLAKWVENCKKTRSELNLKLTERKEAKIRADATVNALEQQKNSLHNNSINWRANHEAKIRVAQDAIEKAKQDQMLANEKIDTVTLELQALEKVAYPIADIHHGLDYFNGMIGDFTPKITNNEWYLKDLQKTRDKIHSNQMLMSPFCITCNQPIPLDVFKKQQEDLWAALKDTETKIENTKKFLKSQREDLQFFKDQLEYGNQKYVQATENQENIKNAKNKLEVLASHQHDAMTNIYVDNLKALEQEKNPYEEMLGSILKQFEIHKTKAANEKESLDLLEEEIRLVKLWEDGYAYDIKTMLIDQACPFLEERTNKYMQDLNNPQIRATFSTLKALKSGDSKDEFNIEVKSMTGGKEFDLFSGGEQQLTSFACGMALADLASSQVEGQSELLILDEPFMGLSSKNSENIISFLTQVISKKKSTILLISNEEELKSLIPQSIHVVKKNGISSLET